MSKFTVLIVNNKKSTAIVVATVIAKNEKQARIEATSKYFQYLESGEQLVVASDNRYVKYYKDMVDSTDAMM